MSRFVTYAIPQDFDRLRSHLGAAVQAVITLEAANDSQGRS